MSRQNRRIPYSELPKLTETPLGWKYTQKAIKYFADHCRPWDPTCRAEDEDYKAKFLLTKEAYIAHLEKQSIYADAQPRILNMAKDEKKEFHDCGVDTKKLRVWLKTGLDRLKESKETSLEAIYRSWVTDMKAREQIHYVRQELITDELFLMRQEKASADPDKVWQAESHWCEEEGRFLDGVKSRLTEIRNLNEPLVRKEEEKERAAADLEKQRQKLEKMKLEQEEKKKAEEKKKEEEKKKKEEEEAKRKAEEEERKKKADEQAAAGKAAVANVQNKMAAYQAEMKALQEKMAKGQIDGATFGKEVGLLSKKYF